jgi:hypothetical protein
VKRSDRHRSDYLWDPEAEPDPAIARLELALEPLADRSEPPEWPAELGEAVRSQEETRGDRRPRGWAGGWPQGWPRGWRPALAAALAASVIGAAGLALWLTGGEDWEVFVVAGAAEIDGREAGEGARLGPGERLITGADGRARLRLPLVGELELAPESELTLLRSRVHAQRFRLERGTLGARVWAAPGVFQVDTPAVRAIDLGCAYELEVDRRGAGRLAVTSGWVALVDNGRESFVPAGAWAAFDHRGPGIPLWRDAPPALERAVARLEAAAAGEPRRPSIEAALAASRERDALTLWHLLARAAAEERGPIADRLAEIVPPPPEAPREAILAGDRAALDAWWGALELGSTSWWRLWRQPMP